jgi:rare lipoprotein A
MRAPISLAEPYPPCAPGQRSLTVASLLLCAALQACGGSNSPPQPRSTAQPEETFDPRQYYQKRAVLVGRGRASYYADSLAGRQTANGERYDPNAYTAAHRSLPFGSILRVTREQTGAWVLVRVNDRGPYARGRVIDLSKVAAKRLSMLRDGVVKVRVEILEMGQGRR